MGSAIVSAMLWVLQKLICMPDVVYALQVPRIDDGDFQRLVLSTLARHQVDHRRAAARLDRLGCRRSVWDAVGLIYVGFMLAQAVSWLADGRFRGTRAAPDD